MTALAISTQELARRLHVHPVRQATIPLEHHLSWWVPIFRPEDDKLYLACFFYPVVRRGREPAQVGRPRYQVTVDAADGRIVALTDCAYHDFGAAVPTGPVVGVLAPEQSPAATVAEWEAQRDALYAAYDRILAFAFRPVSDLTAEQRQERERFAALFTRLAEPCLREFYQALSPRFFAWLREENDA